MVMMEAKQRDQRLEDGSEVNAGANRRSVHRLRHGTGNHQQVKDTKATRKTVRYFFILFLLSF